MKPVNLIIIICSFASSAFSQVVLPLYPGKYKVPNTEVWTHNHTDVKAVNQPEISIFLPNDKQAEHTAIILCPGGGYSHLSISRGGFDAAKELVKKGIVAIVLKYRTAPSQSDSAFANLPLTDLQQAISIVRSRAKEWKICPNRVGVMGFSAGGHLALMAATQYEHSLIASDPVNLRPDFTLLAYPVISFTDELTSPHSQSRHNLLGSHPSMHQKLYFSPELHVTDRTPPAFLVHAANDSTVMSDNSLRYYSALRKHKIPTEILLYTKGGHGFGIFNSEQQEYWLPLSINWLKVIGMLP